MPVYGLPTALESSLNTLLTQDQPNSWRVSSHGDDVTVVIRWPKSGLPFREKLVHHHQHHNNNKSLNEDSCGEEPSSVKHKRHMWSRQGKSSHKHARKEIEANAKSEFNAAATKSESKDGGRRRHYDSSYPSSTSTAAPFPVYLTTSGQAHHQAISYAYGNSGEKVRGSPRQATMPPSSDEVHTISKSHRHLKDIGKSESFSGRSSRTSSPSSSSASSSAFSAASASASASSATNSNSNINNPRVSSSHRRRVKSESSFSLDAKSSSAFAMNESTENFYHTIAQALQGYGDRQGESAADTPFRLGSPVHILTSGSVDGHPVDEEGMVVIHMETDSKFEAGIHSFRDNRWGGSLEEVKGEEDL